MLRCVILVAALAADGEVFGHIDIFQQVPVYFFGVFEQAGVCAANDCRVPLIRCGLVERQFRSGKISQDRFDELIGLYPAVAREGDFDVQDAELGGYPPDDSSFP